MNAAKTLQVWQSEWASATADVLTSAADHAGIFRVGAPITVMGIGALITTLIDGACVVKADRRVLTASDTGRGDGDVGILTIPDATAVGKLVVSGAMFQKAGDASTIHLRKDLNAGDEVVFQVTSAAATAGGAQYFLWFVPRDEFVDNEGDWVRSTT